MKKERKSKDIVVLLFFSHDYIKGFISSSGVFYSFNDKKGVNI
jgi:hypothetical protein